MDNDEKKLIVTAKHLIAVTGIFARGLGLSLNDQSVKQRLAIAFNATFGGNIPTYGDLLSLAQEDFVVAREGFKDAGLTIPTIPFKRCLTQLAAISPTTPVCAKCEQFPFNTEGKIETRGLCPLCHGALIAEEEATVTFVSWATGQPVSATKLVDTTTSPGIPLPLTNEGIVEWLGKNNLNPTIEKNMNLFNNDLVLLLRYLREVHSKQNQRLQQPPACLRFLIDPGAYDIFSELQMVALLTEVGKYVAGVKNTPIVTAEQHSIWPREWYRDNFRVNWPLKAVQEFADLTANSMPTSDIIQEFISRYTEIKPYNIDWNQPGDLIWHSILNLAASMGCLDSIVKGVLAFDRTKGARPRYIELLSRKS